MKARQLSISHSSVFALGMIDQLRYIERGPDGFWGGWHVTGANARHIVHVGAVVARIGLDHRLAAWQRSPREPWHTWDLQVVDLVATRLPEGAPALFACDAAGEVWHTLKPSPGGAWTPLEPLGGPVAGLAAGVIPRGGLVVVGIRKGVAVHRWQDQPGGPWQDWTPLDAVRGEIVSLALTAIAGGGLAVFALTHDGALHHTWQNKPFAPWQGWEELGEGLRSIAVTRAVRGGLAVFATDLDDEVRVRTQARPFGEWRQWNDLGARARHLAAQPSWTDGLEVFAIGIDDEIRHTWCDRLDRPWTAWRPLDHETAPLALPHGSPAAQPEG